MKLAKTEIWRAAAKDKDRPVLQGVHVNAEKARLEAADGFIMAVTPITLDEGEEIAGGIVPAKAVQESYRMSRPMSKTPALYQQNGDFVTGSESAYPDGKEKERGPSFPAIEGLFPNCDQIIPDESDYEWVLTLDIDMLHRLAKAICEDERNSSNPDLKVRLFKRKGSNTSPIVARPMADSKNLGLIMPIFDNKYTEE